MTATRSRSASTSSATWSADDGGRHHRGRRRHGPRGRGAAGAARDSPSRPRKALTIGAVAKILSQEFDDISISKIRYLEDQKLLAPRRTQGGYRLYSQADVERLRAILRMQRDEFLPLRVIRQELATGDFTGSRRGSEAAATRRAASVDAPVSTLAPEELARPGGGVGGAPARASGVRHRPARPSRRADRSTTRPTSRSSARQPSSRGSASPGAICASSGPPPTARRRCSSSSSARRFARAARLAARRRSRTWRAWRRSAGISSICCSSGTCAASRRLGRCKRPAAAPQASAPPG